VIQSVIDHSQRLIGDGFLATLFGDVLAQQSIKVLIAYSLSTAVRIGNAGLNTPGLIDALVVTVAITKYPFLRSTSVLITFCLCAAPIAARPLWLCRREHANRPIRG
jgi:hypothetical protein